MQYQNSLQQKGRSNKKLFYAILVILVAVGCYEILLMPSQLDKSLQNITSGKAALSQEAVKPPPNPEVSLNPIAATFIQNMLKSPSTAEFGWGSINHERKGGNRWEVTGWVDSQNSFGATVRSDWTIMLQLNHPCKDYDQLSCWEIVNKPIMRTR